jgi:BRCA1 C Terminus (BRCT) domain
MPAVGPQGSRSGLVTAVVVFTILFVTATIFAIYFGVDDNKNTAQLQTQNNRTKQIYSAQDMANKRYAEIANRLRPGQTVLGVAFEDSQNLADFVAGKTVGAATQPTSVEDNARAALEAASSRIPGLNLTPGTNLVTAINMLANYAESQQVQNTALRNDESDAAQDAAKQIAAAEELTQKAKDDLAAADKIKQDALDQAQKFQSDYQQKTNEMAQAMDKERADFNAQLQKLQGLADAKDKQLDEKTKFADALSDKLAQRRINPIDPIMRRAEGQITSVAPEDIVYINLGMGDHIVRGMTFEVYNRRDGVPKQDDMMSPDDMPVGEGSIEVEEVGATVSQCRVIKSEIGQHISNGDLIANLVYDRNTKYNFVVYGDFDLGQTGQPKPADGDKIKELIREWGGKVQNKIDVDTDFVVLGTEPDVKTFTPEELQDPLNVSIQQRQKAAVDAYDSELDQAKQLHIPIMNQNRFLYFCGYYDNAQR